jgi:Fur family ferric uptake transcriptional regulator
MPPARPATEDAVLAPLCSIFRRYLKRQGLKFTTERAIILNSVLQKQGVFEADRLVIELRGHERRVSKATIYRTLKHLQDAGIITEVLLDARQAHYELTYGREPKGHLVCLETKRVIEFPLAELAALRDRICAEHGFDAVSARLVIYGVSPEAKQSAEAEAGDDE